MVRKTEIERDRDSERDWERVTKNERRRKKDVAKMR